MPPGAEPVARLSQPRLQLLIFRQTSSDPVGLRCPRRKYKSAISRRLNYLLVASSISCWAGAPAIRGRTVTLRCLRRAREKALRAASDAMLGGRLTTLGTQLERGRNHT